MDWMDVEWNRTTHNSPNIIFSMFHMCQLAVSRGGLVCSLLIQQKNGDKLFICKYIPVGFILHQHRCHLAGKMEFISSEY